MTAEQYLKQTIADMVFQIAILQEQLEKANQPKEEVKKPNAK